MNQPIATYTNKEDGMESYVIQRHNGFHVTLKDLDADQFVTYLCICPNVELAKSKAEKLVNNK